MQVESTPDFESPLAIFRRVFRRIHATTASGQSEPLLEVRFRPFLNATANIRFRDGILRIQATELLASAPIPVLEALFTILLCKLYRLRVPKAMNELYRQHLHGSQFRQQVQQVRQSRGRKVQAPPRGRQYDLDAMFAEINQRHFAGGLARPKLGWSLKDSPPCSGISTPTTIRSPSRDSSIRRACRPTWLSMCCITRCCTSNIPFVLKVAGARCTRRNSGPKRKSTPITKRPIRH